MRCSATSPQQVRAAAGIHPARPARATSPGPTTLDRPDGYRPWRRPEPRPPLEARPTRLSVSSIEQWRRDPYGLYARRILGLDALDPLEAELGAADRGNALHDALDEFLRAHPSGLLPPGAVAEFEALGEKHLGALLTAPAERAFWWPRFQRLARWFIATENERRRSRHAAARAARSRAR